MPRVPDATGQQGPRERTATSRDRQASKEAEAAVEAPKIAPGERFRSPARLVGAQPKIQGWVPVLLLTALSLAACCLMFPTVGWWPLGYVCLVPWLVCVCAAKRSRFVYLISFLFGLGYFLINVYWLYAVTPPGYFALCLYYALFFPLVAWPVRHMYTRHGVSLALSVPIAWVAAEYLRSIAVLGFPWLLLAHSQYQNLTVIQISDLVGAYGVSFVLAMVNGWLTDLLIQPILIWRADRGTRLPIGSLTTLLVVAGTMIYGSAQRSKTFFEPGPTVATVQHDFPMFVEEDRAGSISPELAFRSYLDLARQAATRKPDLIVLPETPIAGYINDEFLNASPTDLDEIGRRRGFSLQLMKLYQRFSRQTRDAFQQLSTETGIPIVLGSLAIEWRPTAIPPRVDAFNSAFLLKPGETRPAGRYDKIHLVLFGEYVPFRTSYPPLYKWLNSKTPWGRMGIEYSLTAGQKYTVFEFEAASQGGREYRAAAPICYEEVMPYIAREFTRGSGETPGRKNIDLLLSISNDGWFLHTSELEQHMAAAVFRAVENRIPVARSVNTGASGLVHPNGKIHMRVAMSEEKMALLEPVAERLRDLDGLAEKLEGQLDGGEAYERMRGELITTLMEGLDPALQVLGTEFSYIGQRLGQLAALLGTTTNEGRLEGLRQFRSQVADDLQTIARWKSKPWMAPGFGIAQAQCDKRLTIYTRWGDWFAQGTAALFAMMLLDWLLRRIRRLSATAKTTEGGPG
ncbi:MAG TPA: apolipoprotein N-acyltransferase [Phycisphaerae bacterium]|nr:apolipoprotein N-acyltransferase [Phycisphaerae bacterium]